ncbi:MAG: nucleoside triphosphate pyrophosphohydrolase [Myxococcota bacterium]
MDTLTDGEMGPAEAFERLVDVMERLRSDDGCPWDREQTLSSLKPFLLEETYEVLEAIDSENVDDHKEELGDLLLQVLFQSKIREEEGSFDIAEVARGITDKLIRRHPHVFAGERLASSEEVVQNWEDIKRNEKKDRDSILDGVPEALAALLRSQRLQEKAARAGFDWEHTEDVWPKVEEEMEELRQAEASGDAASVEQEVGDLLFSVVNLSRHLGVDAEDALRKSSRRFERRFREVERRLSKRGRSPSEASLQELDELWDEVKSEE